MNTEPIIVTTPSFGKFSAKPWERTAELGLNLRYSEEPGPLNEDQLLRAAAEAIGIIVGVDRVTSRVLQGLPKLKVIGKHGVGVDNIDLDAAEKLGITVVSTPGANASAVAEMAMALMLAASRNLLPLEQGLRAGTWPVLPGLGLEGKTLGLIGFGNIGRLVAEMAAGFKLRIIFYDPYVQQSPSIRAEQVDLETLLSHSDFVSLHLPHQPGQAPLLDAKALKLLKPSAGLINTARGGLIDDSALASALNRDELAFAALDAFRTEPLPQDSPLRTAKNTLLTPHAAAFNDIANERMGVSVVEDVERVLRGEAPLNPVLSH